ncbi:MAG: hypothetical protein QMD00_01580, partial [Hadesarchaea archaeon]|nr:hypothetical protein [Hadesarchaea archaeon]
MEVTEEAGETLDDVTIEGTINSGGSLRVQLSNPKPVRSTLKVEVPDSEGDSGSDPMAGSYTVVVSASGGEVQPKTATFTLSVGQLGDGNFEISL